MWSDTIVASRECRSSNRSCPWSCHSTCPGRVAELLGAAALPEDRFGDDGEIGGRVDQCVRNAGDGVHAGVSTFLGSSLTVDPHVEPGGGVGWKPDVAWAVLRSRTVATAVLDDEVATQVGHVEARSRRPVEHVLIAVQRVSNCDSDRVGKGTGSTRALKNTRLDFR